MPEKENSSGGKECLCICNWQNILGTHHASAHGGSSDLIVKMLDQIILKMLSLNFSSCLEGVPLEVFKKWGSWFSRIVLCTKSGSLSLDSF